jgi:hypothetical protein
MEGKQIIDIIQSITKKEVNQALFADKNKFDLSNAFGLSGSNLQLPQTLGASKANIPMFTMIEEDANYMLTIPEGSFGGFDWGSTTLSIDKLESEQYLVVVVSEGTTQILELEEDTYLSTVFVLALIYVPPVPEGWKEGFSYNDEEDESKKLQLVYGLPAETIYTIVHYGIGGTGGTIDLPDDYGTYLLRGILTIEGTAAIVSADRGVVINPQGVSIYNMEYQLGAGFNYTMTRELLGKFDSTGIYFYDGVHDDPVSFFRHNEAKVGGWYIYPDRISSIPLDEKDIQEWQAGATYDVDDVVLFEGSHYKCLVAHVANSENKPPDEVIWEELGEEDRRINIYGNGEISTSDFEEGETFTTNDWTYDNWYYPGDVVYCYDYVVCFKKNYSAANNKPFGVDQTPLENWKNYWQEAGISSAPTWTADGLYDPGDTVEHNNEFFVCIAKHNAASVSGDEPGVGISWQTYWTSLDTSGARGTGWKISSDGDAYFNDVTVFGTLYSGRGNIAGWQITPGYIANGNIVLASKGEIFTANYIPEVSGWKIRYDGLAEFNNAIIRSTLYSDAGYIGNWNITNGKISSRQSLEETQFSNGEGTIELDYDAVELIYVRDLVTGLLYKQADLTFEPPKTIRGLETTREHLIKYITSNEGIIIDSGGTIGANYVVGTSGWQIRDDGSAEFNDFIARGTGSIGGWTIDGNKLRAGEIELDATPDNEQITTGNVTLSENGINITKGNINLGLGNFVVTDDGELTAKEGHIAGWNITDTKLYKGGLSLDSDYNRFEVKVDSSYKMAFGYLENIPKSDGGVYASDIYGIWVGAPDALYIEAPAGGDEVIQQIQGDWIVRNDANILIKDGTGKAVLNIGTHSGERGLTLYGSDNWGLGVAYSVDQVVYHKYDATHYGYFECKVAHTSQASNEPKVGASWTAYWTEVSRDSQKVLAKYTSSGVLINIGDDDLLIGNDVDGSYDGIYFSEYNKWLTNGTFMLGTESDYGLWWDGETLHVKGGGEFQSGNIGGWNIGETTIYSDDNEVVLDSANHIISVDGGNLVIGKDVKSSYSIAHYGIKVLGDYWYSNGSYSFLELGDKFHWNSQLGLLTIEGRIISNSIIGSDAWKVSDDALYHGLSISTYSIMLNGATSQINIHKPAGADNPAISLGYSVGNYGQHGLSFNRTDLGLETVNYWLWDSNEILFKVGSSTNFIDFNVSEKGHLNIHSDMFDLQSSNMRIKSGDYPYIQLGANAYGEQGIWTGMDGDGFWKFSAVNAEGSYLKVSHSEFNLQTGTFLLATNDGSYISGNGNLIDILSYNFNLTSNNLEIKSGVSPYIKLGTDTDNYALTDRGLLRTLPSAEKIQSIKLEVRYKSDELFKFAEVPEISFSTDAGKTWSEWRGCAFYKTFPDSASSSSSGDYPEVGEWTWITFDPEFYEWGKNIIGQSLADLYLIIRFPNTDPEIAIQKAILYINSKEVGVLEGVNWSSRAAEDTDNVAYTNDGIVSADGTNPYYWEQNKTIGNYAPFTYAGGGYNDLPFVGLSGEGSAFDLDYGDALTRRVATVLASDEVTFSGEEGEISKFISFGVQLPPSSYEVVLFPTSWEYTKPGIDINSFAYSLFLHANKYTGSFEIENYIQANAEDDIINHGSINKPIEVTPITVLQGSGTTKVSIRVSHFGGLNIYAGTLTHSYESSGDNLGNYTVKAYKTRSGLYTHTLVITWGDGTSSQMEGLLGAIRLSDITEYKSNMDKIPIRGKVRWMVFEGGGLTDE